jgi:molybdopterin converting factor small subunit
MARVTFTPHLERFIDAPAAEVSASSVADALARVFDANPRLRHYVLDDHGRLRPHMNIFVNGQLTKDRARLSDAIDADAEIFVMQALSGG